MHASNIIALLETEHAAITSVAAGAPLLQALDKLVSGIEALFGDEMRACILLLDADDRFSAVAAPNLPEAYRLTLLGAETGPRSSPFGNAAFSGAPVFSGDIAQDHAWTDGRKAALLLGFRACWAAPVFSAKGRILGVLGLLFHGHRHPTQSETDLLAIATRGAAHIVERHRTDKSVSDSDQHFRHVVELNPHALWTALPDGQFDYVGKRWRDWTGGPGLGATWSEAIHPDDLAATQAAWQRACADGTPYDVEHRVRVRGGLYRWMRAHAACRRGPEGNIVKWYGATEDIQEQWDARQALRKSEAEFSMLAKAMPNQAWAAHADGAVYWCNDRLYEYSGAQPGQLDGAGWLMLLHPDDVGNAQRAWMKSIASGTPYEVEYRLRRGADDSYRWFLTRALPVRDAAGQVLRWVGTSTDVQAQKNVADKLTYLNESLEIEVAHRTADRDRMWRLSTDIMLVADFTSLIIAVNPAWTRVLGRSEMETLGMDFLNLVHVDDRPATLLEVGKLERGETTLHFENRYLHQDGSYRWISWTAVPSDGLVHAIGRDITEEKLAREALQRSERALLQAQKLESIGKLTGGVAHDFNNVLQIISGNLQLLQTALGDQPLALRRLDTSAAAVARGAKLSSQLLAFARRQPLKPLVTDLGRLLTSMQDLLQRALGEGVAMNIVLQDDLWNTLVDPHQLENVLLNIAINARDAMQGQGTLNIELSNAELDEAYTWRHADVEPGQYVLLAMSDTGPGMSADTLAKIFEPFFTTKKEGEGTGLGLSMAYGFVRQSGGHIKAHSEPGLGATFKVYLPRSLAEAAHAPVKLDGAVMGGAETILVVEDDPQVQATVVDMLRELGYTVLTANDALSALTVIKSGMPIDLLFTDVIMPGPLRSPELARQAKVLLPRLEVLYTSGYTQNAIEHGGRLDPGVELLSKPYRREDLARKLRQLLGREAVKAPSYAAAAPSVAPFQVAAHTTAHTSVRLTSVQVSMPVRVDDPVHAPERAVAAPPRSAEPSATLAPVASMSSAHLRPLPSELAVAPASAPMSAVAAPAPAGRHILLVEDNADARDMTGELLMMLGHTVRAVGSAEEALDLLAVDGLEVLLTDISLPGMSGLELARQARLTQPQLDVIFSSGHARQTTPHDDPAARFLLKPFSIDQLQAALVRRKA